MAKNSIEGRPNKVRFLLSLHYEWSGRFVTAQALLPIIISCLLSGFGVQMLATMIGFAGCAAWLGYDAWIVASIVGTRYANRYNDYRTHVGKFGKSEATHRREQLRRASRSIVFAFMFGIVLLCMSKANSYVIRASISKDQSDIFKNLRGKISSPHGGPRNNMRFTLTNNSVYDVKFLAAACTIRYIQLESGFKLENDSFISQPNLMLHGGGDEQSVDCPQNTGTMGGVGIGIGSGIACGDVTWSVTYVFQRRSRRYTDQKLSVHCESW